MLLRLILGVFAVVLLAGLGWRYHNAPALQEFLAVPNHRPADFRFDNGTVRQYRSASAPATDAPPAAAIGEARRCVRGAETVYTSQPCPPGMREQRLSRGTVNVVSGNANPPAPAAPAQAGRAQPRSLHGVAEPADGTSLREQHIERVINP